MLPGVVGAPSWVSQLAFAMFSSGDCVFIFFAFMAKAQGDISNLALFTGTLVALHETGNFFAIPLMFSFGSTAALGGVVVALMLLGAIVWHAPSSYKAFRIPKVWRQLRRLGKTRVLVLLGIATVLQNFSFKIVDLWSKELLLRDLSAISPQSYLTASAFVVVLSPVVLGVVIGRCPNHAVLIVKAFAFYSLPGMALRAYISYIQKSGDHHGALKYILMLSLVPDNLIFMAASVVILATVGSRWRFTVYQTLITVGTSLAQAVAVLVFEASPLSDLPFVSYGNVVPSTMEKLMLALVFIPSGIAVICRVWAAIYFDQEATGCIRTPRQRRVIKLLQKRVDDVGFPSG